MQLFQSRAFMMRKKYFLLGELNRTIAESSMEIQRLYNLYMAYRRPSSFTSVGSRRRSKPLRKKLQSARAIEALASFSDPSFLRPAHCLRGRHFRGGPQPWLRIFAYSDGKTKMLLAPLVRRRRPLLLVGIFCL